MMRQEFRFCFISLLVFGLFTVLEPVRGGATPLTLNWNALMQAENTERAAWGVTMMVYGDLLCLEAELLRFTACVVHPPNNNNLAAGSQAWTQGCSWGHSTNDARSRDYASRRGVSYVNNYDNYVGENLAAAGGQTVGNTGWINEKNDWTCSSNACRAGAVCGHYTQLVWYRTARYGCGASTCTTGSPFGSSFSTWRYLCCRYNPGGNYNNEHPTNRKCSYGQVSNVNCVVSAWGTWGSCSATCGSGTRTRTRSVTTQPSGSGTACPALSESQSCNTQSCSVNCVVSAWSSWGSCSAQCGGGTRSRSRTVTTQPSNGGSACPALTESGTCNTQTCVNCAVSAWGAWGTCSSQCGGGTRSRSRSITTQPGTGGAACPALTETGTCNTQTCASDCVVSTWGTWGACSANCGGGTRSRTRTITTPATGGGACPGLTETGPCNTQVCAWTSWGTCSESCGGGTRSRTRTITTQPVGSGTPCGALTENGPCNTQAQPCVVSGWGNWGSCSVTCGGGTRSRVRTVSIEPANGGTACPALTDSQASVDCVVSTWSQWSSCSTTCGTGQRTRTRTVTTPAVGTGLSCPPLSEGAPCNTQPCPVDCAVGEWTAWSTCSLTCGTGSRSRSRSIMVQPSNGGLLCPTLSEVSACNTNPCPVDCVLSEWTPWASCTNACGGGTRTRTRSIVRQPANGGATCSNLLSESTNCNTQACPRDCEVSTWSAWSTCSCDSFTYDMIRELLANISYTRERTITVAPVGTGAACPSLSETTQCTSSTCPIPCQVSNWSPWSSCHDITGVTATCGQASRTRSRIITASPQNGGDPCPSLSSLEVCTLPDCDPVDCAVGAWSAFGPCDRACGGGTQVRSRAVTRQAAHGGVECPTLEESQSCNTHQCPSDCVWHPWSDFGACTAECTQTRTRTNTPATGSGAACSGSSSDSRACTEAPCVLPCVWGVWTAWSNCDRQCGAGTQTRTRTATSGTCTGPTSESQVCNTQPCGTACVWNPWNAWSTCSAPCGSGSQSRSRTSNPSTNGGAPCEGPSSQVIPCNEHACPINCIWGTFTEWSTCSVSCGGGQQTRRREVSVPAQNGGVPCEGTAVEVRDCNTDACTPSGCSYSDWTSWGACSAECAGGQRQRTRTITVQGTSGACQDPLTNIEVCNTQPCSVDCQWLPWTSYSQCTTRYWFQSQSNSQYSCGGGVMTRSRARVDSLNGGSECVGNHIERLPCNTEPCDEPCILSEWSTFTTCTATCGNGMRHRFREVLSSGTSCPILIDSQGCNSFECPIDAPQDCITTPWSPWHLCTNKCGPLRERSVEVPAANGGNLCGSLWEQRACNLRPCPGTPGQTSVPSQPTSTTQPTDDSKIDFEKDTAGLPLWAWFVIGGAALLIIIAVVVLIILGVKGIICGGGGNNFSAYDSF